MRRALILSLAAVLPAGAGVSYNREVRPLLADRCFACHGFDAAKRKGDLRLDTEAGAKTKNADGRAAVVPGNAEASQLWVRLTSGDPDEVMPPPESHKTVSPEERALLRRWIEEGAPYEGHWAFEGPRPAAVPGSGHPVDAFIEARARSAGLTLRPEANRETLIRRVSLALTGLPPAAEEIDAFLTDAADGANERMVDRYLASPRYGEEMARHWLDAARYGDTHGMHLDNERQMWPWRDWVVRAFNGNLGFDKFTHWQIAGDLMPEAGSDALLATGFHRCNVTTGEGGSIDAEFVFRYAVDRTSTVAQTWLGLTAGCAVCHDHKYDPMTQRDFYSLYAFFLSGADPAMDGNTLLTPPVMRVTPADHAERVTKLERDEAAAEQRLMAAAEAIGYADPADAVPRPAVEVAEEVWFEDAFPEGAAVGSSGHPLTYVDAPVFSGKKSLRRTGAAGGQNYYESGASPLRVPTEATLFVHVLVDAADPPGEVMVQFHAGAWKHRALWGADVIEFGAKGTTERHAAGPLPEAGKWVRLEVPAEKMGLSAGMAITGYAFTVDKGTVHFDRMGMKGKRDPAADPAVSFAAWRRARAGKDTPGLPAAAQAWLKAGPDAPRQPDELKRLRALYLGLACAATKDRLREAADGLTTARKAREAYEAGLPSSFVWKDLAQSREAFVMQRGQYDKPGDKVEPGTPGFLPPLRREGGARATRRHLAEWLTARDNPLTARVGVNRFWQQLFGTGLVETSHDFGTQGSVPSHPELLDWLAVWWMDNGWDVKKLVRLLVTSAAFRRESAADAEAWRADPANRLLARGPRFRLDAEQLRDQALFAGGLLDLTMGGRGARPYQPPNIWEPVGFVGSNTRFYEQDKGPGLHRRSLYTFLKRTAPPPFMVNFDAPSREQSCSRRERSNTPLQALQLLNDVQHVEAARGLAARAMAAAGDAAGRLAFLCRTVLARRPSGEEAAILTELLEGRLAHYRATPEAARQLVATGATPPPAVDAAELAAWTMVANTVLNLDEAITRN